MTEPKTLRTVKVREYVDGAQIKKDVAYSTADLSGAMQNQASMLSHYGVEAAKASRQVDDIKLLLDVTESKIYRRLRDEFLAAKEKVTEVQLDKAVATHNQVIEIKKALNAAKQIEATAKIAVEAFKHRRDMLIQEGSTSREELKGELSISRKRAHDDLIDRQKQSFLERQKEARGE